MTSALPRCVVVILTYNCDGIIEETVTQARRVSPWIYAVDSRSNDTTLAILQRLNCEIAERSFRNYSDQRNWAIAQVQDRAQWQLHLDADEVLDERAISAIRAVIYESAGSPAKAFLLRRRDYFMGKELRFSGLNPWHLRLFPSGRGQCEDRLYDQHFLSDLPVAKLSGLMHDKNSQNLAEWVTRHNRWSDLEAEQAGRAGALGVLQPALSADPRQRSRLLKAGYYGLPVGLRSLIYFVYRYVLRGGFLDGRVGFYFAIFQALWFRALVDAKIEERATLLNATLKCPSKVGLPPGGM